MVSAGGCEAVAVAAGEEEPLSVRGGVSMVAWDVVALTDRQARGQTDSGHAGRRPP